ncbi:hypothetical protein NDU88_003428 [Pleurodeles waltl]|uniref:Uncharacterized protein n=1 Tax=Pleurodeles waltl TaxID=8319 RepID=A0AAV7M8S6_PLEWA|nr:hypothetical protein NDU88_003428 [Pleurodeles waltl]
MHPGNGRAAALVTGRGSQPTPVPATTRIGAEPGALVLQFYGGRYWALAHISALPGRRPRVAAHLHAARCTRRSGAWRPGASIFSGAILGPGPDRPSPRTRPVGHNPPRVGGCSLRSGAWHPGVSNFWGRNWALALISVHLGRRSQVAGPGSSPLRPLFVSEWSLVPWCFNFWGATLGSGADRHPSRLRAPAHLHTGLRSLRWAAATPRVKPQLLLGVLGG